MLRTILSQAVTDELVARNVARPVKLPSSRTHKRKSWSTDEARAFLESARSDGDPLYAAYVLVLVLGLRRGEMLGLGLEDLGVDLDELTVEWQLQRVGDPLMRRRTKTETSDATLPLPAICSVALKGHLAARGRLRDEARSVWREAGYVFTTRFGTPIEPRNFNRYWTRRCDAAKARRITVHDARRTCASLLADLDVHPRVAMQILRHGQFSITMEIYTQVSSTATREAVRRLGESLG